MYISARFIALASLALRARASTITPSQAASSSIPVYTFTEAACTTPLSQEDVGNSWGNPCPGFFEPLPVQGALSNGQLTLFGVPALVDFSGSVVATDATSTTYALTCAESGLDVLEAQVCTDKGAVVSLTASGWNWHIRATSSDKYNAAFQTYTQTIDPSGHISFSYSVTYDTIISGKPVSYSLGGSDTYTWTGSVARADPSIAPITGLEKLGGTYASTTAQAGSTGSAATAASISGMATTTNTVHSAASVAASSASSSGAAAPQALSRHHTVDDWMWTTLGMSSLLVATLALVL